jgi:hypothetical protein
MARGTARTLAMNRHPGRPDQYACAGCHKPGSDGATIVPFGTEPGNATWLHPACWPEWNEKRRSEARRALSDIGIGHSADDDR